MHLCGIASHILIYRDNIILHYNTTNNGFHTNNNYYCIFQYSIHHVQTGALVQSPWDAIKPQKIGVYHVQTYVLYMYKNNSTKQIDAR